MKNSMYVLMMLLALLSCQKKANVLPPGEKQNVKEAAVKGNSNLSISSNAPQGYSLVWEDNFDGTSLNPNNWFAGCKDPVSGDLITGSSGEGRTTDSYAGYNTQEDVYVQNGSLVLRGQKRTYQGTSPAGTYQYTNGWVMSMHRLHINKGYIEIRAKFPSGDKVWPALWMCAEDIVWGPEWDIAEYFGTRVGSSDLMACNLMTGTYDGSNASTHWYAHDINSFDATYDCETWHVYGFEWTADYAKWYIDGNLIRTLYASSVIEWPNEEMYLIMNNGQHSSSPDATTTWPNYLEIDYVHVYQKQYTTLNNGGFETGSQSPWSSYGSSAVSSSNQYAGNYCANIGGNNAGLEYVISGLSPNTSYTFRGYVKSSNGTMAYINARDYGGNLVSASTTNTAYTKLSVPFTTGSTNTSARLFFYRWNSGAGQAYGDDFEIYQTPAVINGNFESGTKPPWTGYGSNSVVSGNQHAGSYCGNIGADNSGLEYVVTGLRPNTSYTFRGYVRSSNGTMAYINARDYGGNLVSASTTSTSYTLLSVPFTTGSANTSARLFFYRWNSGAGQAFGDDFEIIEN